jgi:tetratricopeptide (TPR) repeat protein
MLSKLLFLFVFLLSSAWTFAQKPAKSSKELSKNLISVLQTQDKQMLSSLFAPPAIYKLFAPHLKEMSDTEIANMLKNDDNSLEKKIEGIFANMEQFGLSGKELQWKSVGEKPLNTIATGYFALDIVLTYKNTTDTLSVEAFKNKKNWYLVDIVGVNRPLNKVILKHSQYSWQQYYDMALSQIKDKKYEEALNSLKSAEFLSPKSPEIYHQRGNIYNLQKDVFRALEMYRKANQVDADYMPAYFEAALLSFNNAEIAYEAVYNFEICVEKEYEVLTSSKYLLDIYLKQIMDFEQDAYIEDTYLKNYYEKIFATASKILEKENELNVEEKIKVYLARAVSLMDLKKYDDARKDFEKVLSLQPLHPKALYELAWIENETQNYAKALDYAKKAYELDKTNGEVLAELAFAKMQTKDFKGAINDYNTLFGLGKEFQTAKKYQNRGDCYKALKNNKMACADYKKAIEFGADDSTMQEWIKKNCK